MRDPGDSAIGPLSFQNRQNAGRSQNVTDGNQLNHQEALPDSPVMVAFTNHFLALMPDARAIPLEKAAVIRHKALSHPRVSFAKSAIRTGVLIEALKRGFSLRRGKIAPPRNRTGCDPKEYEPLECEPLQWKERPKRDRPIP